MNGWRKGWMNEEKNEYMNKRMNKWTKEEINEKNEEMKKIMNRINKRMNKWYINEWMFRPGMRCLKGPGSSWSPGLGTTSPSWRKPRCPQTNYSLRRLYRLVDHG